MSVTTASTIRVDMRHVRRLYTKKEPAVCVIQASLHLMGGTAANQTPTDLRSTKNSVAAPRREGASAVLVRIIWFQKWSGARKRGAPWVGGGDISVPIAFS